MRKIVMISLIFFMGLNLKGQYPFINPGIFYMPAPGPEKYYADKYDKADSDDHSWARYQIRTGIMFNSLNGYNSFNSWISPSVLLPVNSRFAISIEGTYINSYFPGFTEENELGRTSDFIVSVSGIYSVNEKMTIFGQYSKSLMNEGMFGRDGFQSMTLGMEFMPLPNFRIGASITSTNGFNPYYIHPAYTPYSPYPYRPFY
ncbi:MAG: hypothetical protein RQ743_04510 [Bacteroidales bacterium]|nr:hypothetical protein [Bacteroidales bacterium]